MSSLSAELAKRGSQGRKTVPCVRCQGEIQPYAGVRVTLYAERYAHHPGQCRDAGECSVSVSDAARQGTLFAWTCRKVEPAQGDNAAVCDSHGTDRAEYERHMSDVHGLKHGLSDYKPIRLRRRAPAASLPKPSTDVHSAITWHEVIRGEWQAGVGNPILSERDRSGQYWSEGADPHSVWVVPFAPAPWRAGGPPGQARAALLARQRHVVNGLEPRQVRPPRR